jgi:RHS repeat-associated protein
MPTHSRKTILLATDQQRSVLNALDENRPHPIAYTPYGHRPLESGLFSLLGFNGEQPDPVTGHYHLGNGYRQFNPVLMRFNSPDSWSPFGRGGLNAYAYCLGDPVNRVELDGHSSLWIRIWKGFRNRIGVRTPKKFRTTPPVPEQSQTKKSGLSVPSKPPEKPINIVQNQLSKNTVNTNKTSTSLSKTYNASSPHKIQDSSDITRRRLLNRRTKSLDHTPGISDETLVSFYESKKYDPDGDFLTSQFATVPTSTHAKLYAAMYSEFSEVPTAQIQRTIRTGGRK